MMSAMFAATMSSMDSALNKNSAIFVRSVYSVFINKDTEDAKLLKIGKAMTLVFGIIIIAVGIFINSLESISLFNATVMVSSLLAMPMMIPAVLGFFVKKTPDWAAWGTLLVGVAVSYFIAMVMTSDMVSAVLGFQITADEFSDMKSMTIPIILHGCITTPFFFLSKLFYKGHSPEREKELNEFFVNINTPVIVDEEDVNVMESDRRQRKTLGGLLATAGGMIMLMFLIPGNTMISRSIFVFVGGIVLVAGLGLLRTAKEKVEA
ncbi:MAG: hypothetical protein R3Y40_04260, partial [Eubacteriales bacterium]